MYSHSGAMLPAVSKMLEYLVNFIAKCKLSEFAIGFCHSKKMYNRTNVRSKLLLLGHLPNLVGHCPMSDSNLQPCIVTPAFQLCVFIHTYIQTLFIHANLNNKQADFHEGRDLELFTG